MRIYDIMILFISIQKLLSSSSIQLIASTTKYILYILNFKIKARSGTDWVCSRPGGHHEIFDEEFRGQRGGLGPAGVWWGPSQSSQGPAASDETPTDSLAQIK